MKTINEKADALKSKYSKSILNLNVQNDKRIWLFADNTNFINLFKNFINDGFNILCTITGLDNAEDHSVIYHMSDKTGVMLNIEISVSKNNPVICSITDLFPAAELSEKELEDLLGIKVDGLQKGRRYPLPDDWPEEQYPLRKDWDPKSLDNKKI